jgi:antitoxin component YwqK of YwqJK toxin-antitoxin module
MRWRNRYSCHKGFAPPVTTRSTVSYQVEKPESGVVMNSLKKTISMNGLKQLRVDEAKNGRWKYFNKHGTLISEGNYVDDKKHGTWREYYDHTGTIMIEEEFDYDIQHGRFRSFHPNGQVLSDGRFCNGLREGYFKVFDEFGNNVRNMFFINNIQIEDFGTLKGLEVKEENKQH